jgi:SAM-dependent methyltransferase
MSVVKRLWHILPHGLRHMIGGTLPDRTHRRWMLLVDWWMNRRYGIETGKVWAASDAPTVGQDASRNIASYYARTLRMRRELSPGPNDVFIDLGCGDGRVVFVFAKVGGARAIGAEIDPGAVERCRQNLQTFKGPRERIEFEVCDCAVRKYTDETIFFFYQPFGSATMGRVLENIHESVKANPRRLRLCFYGDVRRAMSTVTWLRLAREVHMFRQTFQIYELAG